MFRVIASPEQKYRVHEGDEKTQRAVKLALGDRVKDMFQVQLVATAPDKQGYGYGSSLVQVVTSKVVSVILLIIMNCFFLIMILGR